MSNSASRNEMESFRFVRSRPLPLTSCNWRSHMVSWWLKISVVHLRNLGLRWAHGFALFGFAHESLDACTQTRIYSRSPLTTLQALGSKHVCMQVLEVCTELCRCTSRFWLVDFRPSDKVGSLSSYGFTEAVTQVDRTTVYLSGAGDGLQDKEDR